MKPVHEIMEEAYRKKVSLLGALLDCLNHEKENLIHVDVKGLWSLMEEKQKILSSIQETEHVISSYTAENQEEGAKEMRAFGSFIREIRRLKQEIGARVRENVTFIEETLHFFDEIVSIFAAGQVPEYGYEPALRRQRTPSSLIYESEV